jgi:8-oxo-dGTP pyrophosphatase MutT (NUDIX family)
MRSACEGTHQPQRGYNCLGFEARMTTKQFAALPFRIRNNEISVFLITTRRKRRWSVPKGWPIAGYEPQQTAEIEAYEEAGLVGRALSRSVGRYLHRKQKRKMVCEVELFPLEVAKRKKRWPEKGQREAIWIPAKQAAKMVHKPELRRLIERFTRSKRREAASARLIPRQR